MIDCASHLDIRARTSKAAYHYPETVELLDGPSVSSNHLVSFDLIASAVRETCGSYKKQKGGRTRKLPMKVLVSLVVTVSHSTLAFLCDLVNSP